MAGLVGLVRNFCVCLCSLPCRLLHVPFVVSLGIGWGKSKRVGSVCLFGRGNGYILLGGTLFMVSLSLLSHSGLSYALGQFYHS